MFKLVKSIEDQIAAAIKAEELRVKDKAVAIVRTFVDGLESALITEGIVLDDEATAALLVIKNKLIALEPVSQAVEDVTAPVIEP